MCMTAHAELKGKEKQQAAMTSYQTSSADLVRTMRMAHRAWSPGDHPRRLVVVKDN